jgi:uncharacterized protein
VFNLHRQFDAMKRSGKWGPFRDRIRASDQALQGGEPNPVVADFGERSEAPQYAMRRPGG